MGMDVYGKAPLDERGKYFRNNIWWWHPLWDYCMALEGSPIPQNNHGHTNSGWGLDAEDSLVLSLLLFQEIDSGRTKEYEEAYMAQLNSLPDEDCPLCGATGMRAKPPTTGPGDRLCNGCQGSGVIRPFETSYPFSEENVKEFAEFLESCGGFEIC